jgi:hypothetical protein
LLNSFDVREFGKGGEWNNLILFPCHFFRFRKGINEIEIAALLGPDGTSNARFVKGIEFIPKS